MSKPTEIRYPRFEAQIRVVKSKREPVLSARIQAFEQSAAFKEYKALQLELADVQRAKPRFTCWHCKTEKKTKDLVLYNFFSPGDEYNNDRCDDYNVVCPKCGAFSFLKGWKYGDYRFKDTEDI